ncbi:S8/S53 family peptidase [Rhizobium sp. G187]|uniref:S8/S53 family peptidase n=1 Tax=Rhizobium sp. G187 TaxID=3451352 RepID=UPI003EE59870
MIYRIDLMSAAAILAIVAPSGSVQAAEPAADVFVEFSGGAVDRDMAAVVEAFAGDSKILPTRTYMPDQTTGLCTILNGQLNLTPELCTEDMIAAIRNLNAKNGLAINPAAINPKLGVILPDVKTSVTTIDRVYNLGQQQEADRLQQLENNPGWRNTIEKKTTDILSSQNKTDQSLPQLDQLTFKRIAWQFEIANPDNLAEAEYLSNELGGRNLSIDVERSGGFKKAAHSLANISAPAHFKRWCIDQDASAAEGDFADMAGFLYETKNAVTCESENLVRPEIVIMDQAITRHPDLAGAFAASASPLPPQTDRRCVAKPFNRSVDHGTLLSTIVAANANGYGFRGIEPNAMITSFVWDRKAVTNIDLKRFIGQVRAPTEPQVFLFASEFAPYSPHPGPNASEFEIKNAKQIWRMNENNWTDSLANDGVRLKGGLVQEILQSPMLLVASAGQAGDGDEGREITWETPMAPQNLGDHDNLLVVGACTDCDRPTAELWERSNRSNEARRFVAVMAPGGGDMPTYLSDLHVGETIGGTSAAAAFTAGLAARMSSCYPGSYSAQPGRLKQRIVLASRPVADPIAIGHVAGGVADPQVSMLDPRRTWLKLKDVPVRPVEFVKWCSERLKLADDENGSRDSLNLLSTRRLTNADDIGIVQQSVVQSTSSQNIIRHAVKREPPGKAESPDAVLASVRYDADASECAVSINRMTDIFLAEDVRIAGDCADIPLCE